MPDRREIWRTAHVKDAYADQTGRRHWGTVVLERLVVTLTDERYDVDDGYAKHPGLGKVYVVADGRRFGIHPETVDYFGDPHVRALGPKRHGVLDTNVSGEKAENEQGYWRVAPRSVAGYCYPDGSAPVEHLTKEAA